MTCPWLHADGSVSRSKTISARWRSRLQSHLWNWSPGHAWKTILAWCWTTDVGLQSHKLLHWFIVSSLFEQRELFTSASTPVATVMVTEEKVLTTILEKDLFITTAPVDVGLTKTFIHCNPSSDHVAENGMYINPYSTSIVVLIRFISRSNHCYWSENVF